MIRRRISVKMIKYQFVRCLIGSAPSSEQERKNSRRRIQITVINFSNSCLSGGGQIAFLECHEKR